MPKAQLAPILSLLEAVEAAYQVFRPLVMGGALAPELMSCCQQTRMGHQLHSPQ
jgi:hypothetical protein